jgi:DNA gyrase subunit A
MEDEIMLMSSGGALVRTPVRDISVVGRNTQGVRLIRLEEGDRLSGLGGIAGLGREDETDDSVLGEDAAPADDIDGSDTPPPGA